MSPAAGPSAPRARRPPRARGCSSGRHSGTSPRRRAYIGPCSRPDIARIRGVAADSAVANLLERGLIAEAGRDGAAGAVRYRTTPLFERVFGLESLSELPRLDDVGADANEIRDRLHAVAEKRSA
jgi:segregation and condensation protein B